MEPCSSTLGQILRPKGTLEPILPSEYQEFQDLFSPTEAEVLPPHRQCDCAINLEPGAPIPHGKIYSLSPAEEQTMKEYIAENLRKGFIRNSKSPAGAPIFFVEKKDGSLRPCVDYSDLNKITIKDRYPIPLIADLLDQVRQAQWFTKMDLRGAYNLIRIRDQDEWKTAFKCKYGHFEYLVMPFGLTNAPSVFQSFINEIFQDISGIYVTIYLDDLLIYSETLTEHRRHVTEVLTRLRQHQLYAKLEKCVFHVQQVEYLGFVLSPGQVKMDEKKISAVKDWPALSTVKDVQKFVGFANFYRRFIPRFSAIVSPITNLTRKHSAFEWNDEAQKAFDTLKELFCSAPILQQPDQTKQFTVETDASDYALGAVLSQADAQGEWRPVAYYSRQLNPAEQNYTIYEKELLAIKDALKNWRHYLQGAPHVIQIITDHKNLTFIKDAKCQNSRHARWANFFSKFHFNLTYGAGSTNKADALSRLGYEQTNQVDTKRIIEPIATLWNEPFSDKIEVETRREEQAQQLPEHNQTDFQKGILFHQQKIYIPRTLRAQLLEWCHDHKAAGHPGEKRTRELVGRWFWWPKMLQEVKEYVQGCEVCARTKTSRDKPQGLLKPMEAPSRPWSTISMDFVTDLPVSIGNSKKISTHHS